MDRMDQRKKELVEKQVTELVPLVPYTRPGIRSGLKLPGGIILMNMAETSSMTLRLYADQLGAGAKIITVHGTWTFEPDVSTVREYDKPYE